MTLDRRSLLALLAASAVPAAHAAQRKSLADPMLLGVENALMESGLASQFQKAFGRDTGVAVQLVPGHSAALLEALERGELDTSMTNAPEQELQLEKQGLAHDRRLVAVGDFVLVGPLEGKGKKAKDPVGIAGERDITVALAKLAEAQARFVGPAAGSGAHLGTLALVAGRQGRARRALVRRRQGQRAGAGRERRRLHPGRARAVDVAWQQAAGRDGRR